MIAEITIKFPIDSVVKNDRWGEGLVKEIFLHGRIGEDGTLAYEVNYTVLLNGTIRASFDEKELIE